MKNKYNKWLFEEMRKWQETGLVDRETEIKIKAYYKQKENSEPSRLGAMLGVLGTILIGLGIVLILAKNWNEFPRAAKVAISLLPFLIGSIGGLYVIKTEIHGWLRQAAAIFTTIGIVAAVSMNGQIYHVITDEWVLFLMMAVLTLPLVYLYHSTVTLAAYFLLGTICMFLIQRTDLWFKAAVGVLLIGMSIPYIIGCYKKDKLNIETIWCNILLALSGFSFITSLTSHDILLREVYIAYFILLIALDALLYEEIILPSSRPFAVLGNVGIYILLFIFTFSGFWDYIDSRYLNLEYMCMIGLLLAAAFVLTAWLIRTKRRFTRRLFVYLMIASLVIVFRLAGLLESDFEVLLPITLNVCFLFLAVNTLRQGIMDSSISRMNRGLFLLTALIIARFFDSEFSFLIKGIVFIVCGIVFLISNLYLTKKRKKEITNV
jgi:uncharacterized membrane protein